MTIACPECGALQELPALGPRSTAFCSRCRSDLEKTAGRSLAAAHALSCAIFVLLFPTNILPLLRVDILGMHSQDVIAAGVLRLFAHRWLLLAGTAAVCVILLPFLRFGLLAAVLTLIRAGRRPRWLGPAYRWAVWLDLWAMLDVFLLAACVGYYRLVHVSEAHITLEVGGMCFIAAALLTMVLRATLDRRSVWRAIGGEHDVPRGTAALGCTSCDLALPLNTQGTPCPRCGARLRRRRPDALSRTSALLLAAAVLILPANIYPMNISRQLGERLDYTIFTGVRDLFEAGLWPLGIVVFCTSILIPVLKILAIAWCARSVRHPSRRHLESRTRILRLVAEWGRWSKTDPFTIVFFVPLMNFAPLGTQSAGWGATAFVVMSVLTMIASTTFDPRLMWDAAGMNPTA